MRIRILGSVPLTKRVRLRILLFSSVTLDYQQKIIVFANVLCLFLFEGIVGTGSLRTENIFFIHFKKSLFFIYGSLVVYLTCVVLHIFFFRHLPLVQLKYFSMNTVIFVLESASTDIDLNFLSISINIFKYRCSVLSNTYLKMDWVRTIT
jgi:hypothetical protein